MDPLGYISDADAGREDAGIFSCQAAQSRSPPGGGQRREASDVAVGCWWVLFRFGGLILRTIFSVWLVPSCCIVLQSFGVILIACLITILKPCNVSFGIIPYIALFRQGCAKT